MNTEHTPLPLTAYNSYVRDGDGNILLHIECNGEPEKEREQAAFIVRACNAHYDLLEACQLGLDAARSADWAEDSAAVKRLIAALTKAKGEKQ